MYEISGLILPLFGLILLGFIAARITGRPLDELGWLNTFIVYAALPALFFQMLSKTPIEQLARWDFIGANIGVTFSIFVLTFCLGLIATRGLIPEATIQGLAGAYGNIGYMGAALSILALGPTAAIPLALIFCFENVMHFSLAPAFMALSGKRKGSVMRLIADVLRGIAMHPFIIATVAGVGTAAIGVTPPAPFERLIGYLAQAAAPCALFAMGVTLALRPLKSVPTALFYIVPIKLVLHPALMYLVLSYVGDFDRVWVLTAVLLASLPTATNVFIIGQQYNAWVQRASASILVSTIISVLTVSVLLYFIGTNQLPPDLLPSE